jgi:hypothetical protein
MFPSIALAKACEVDELDETNNATEPVALDLPVTVSVASPEAR